MFSYTTAGLHWVLHEWLTQLIFYALHSLGGFHALRLFTGLMALVMLFQFHRLAPAQLSDPMTCAALVTVFALLGTCCMQTRPTLFSMALFRLMVHWLLTHR